MKLSKLELFGFKSFLNRTVFQFNEGVTSIVGPNGCGKSNVVDAMIWALGERGTKSLRVKDMGDVIFHGSNGKRPVNIAEVAIEFVDGNGETVIKRRIYRDGSAEYFLNNKSVRLKDIQDFLLGTGIGMNSYAIIEQGKIEYFIQMKPQERKVVIEETSGVTRFEEKRREASGRLEEVSANLERIDDIYREIIKAYEKSELEWTRWREYKALSDQLTEVDKWILADGHVKILKRLAKVKDREVDLQQEMAKKEEEREKLKEEQETKEKEFGLVDATIRQIEVDIKGQEKDMESRLLEIDYLKEEGSRLEKERISLMKQQEDLGNREKKNLEEIDSLDFRRDEASLLLKEEEEEERRIKDSLTGLKAETERYGAKIEEERVTLFVAMSKLTEIKNRLTEMERIKGEKQKREERKRAEQERLRDKLAGLEERFGGFKETLEKERAEKAQIVSEEQAVLKEKETVFGLVQDRRNRIEQFKGAKRGKEEFVKQMRSLQGVAEENPLNRTKLIDIVRVAEEAEKAVERFFFKEMEYYVLTERASHAIAETVKKHEGNYIFFPEKGMFRPNGHDVAMEVNWIESIEDALSRIEQGEEGLFINDSVCVDSRGFILREKEGKRVDLKSYRERVKAEKELKEIAVTLDGEIAALREDESRYFQWDNRYRDVKGRREGKEKRINGLERESIAVETELRTVRERLYELEAKVEFSEETQEPAIHDFLSEKGAQEQEKARIEAGMTLLKAEMESAKKVHDETLATWHQATLNIERKRNLIKALYEERARKGSLSETLRKEIAAGREKTAEIEKELSQRSTKIISLEKDYEELKRACEKQVERYEELKAASGNIHMERHALQEKEEGLVREMERVRSRREGVEKEMVVLVEKMETVAERLRTTYGIDDPSGMTIPASIDFEAERDRLSKEITGVGEVNFRAEKEYLELKERVSFLERQKEDLKNAADSLRKTITKIEGITKDIFLETFETVNIAFRKFTEMLFKGGKGYLQFNQETMGIDMYVQPPGKKVVRMEQLSGGEKALISLSFLLSLIDTKPSPFVLMDEIDAPLDDANLLALMEIIKAMSAKTQIVFVTHNRITMESSHTIYGVTMEEEGISKTISVRL
jgi:chromosome segregation protein